MVAQGGSLQVRNGPQCRLIEGLNMARLSFSGILLVAMGFLKEREYILNILIMLLQLHIVHFFQSGHSFAMAL